MFSSRLYPFICVHFLWSWDFFSCLHFEASSFFGYDIRFDYAKFLFCVWCFFYLTPIYNRVFISFFSLAKNILKAWYFLHICNFDFSGVWRIIYIYIYRERERERGREKEREWEREKVGERVSRKKEGDFVIWSVYSVNKVKSFLLRKILTRYKIAFYKQLVIIYIYVCACVYVCVCVYAFVWIRFRASSEVWPLWSE